MNLAVIQHRFVTVDQCCGLKYSLELEKTFCSKHRAIACVKLTHNLEGIWQCV